jgi:hypothetical protein
MTRLGLCEGIIRIDRVSQAHFSTPISFHTRLKLGGMKSSIARHAVVR